jgi:hypothetical protein
LNDEKSAGPTEICHGDYTPISSCIAEESMRSIDQEITFFLFKLGYIQTIMHLSVIGLIQERWYARYQ